MRARGGARTSGVKESESARPSLPIQPPLAATMPLTASKSPFCGLVSGSIRASYSSFQGEGAPGRAAAQASPADRSSAAQPHPEAAMSKRGAQSNLNKDNWEEQIDAEGPTEMGTWQKADEARAGPVS